MRKTITLTHYDNGPMQVAVWDEATWWMRRRQWTCPDDEERGTFEDEDFDESKEQIEALLSAAHAAADAGSGRPNSVDRSGAAEAGHR
jgi:hypothetical protein